MKAALNLVSDMDLQHPVEYLLNAITYCIFGYQKQSKEHLKLAQEHFKVVGESAVECDTIIGRQAVASSYFLNNQFDEVLTYLNSIKIYFHDDDTFNFNIGQALLACGKSTEAEAKLLLVVDEEFRKKPAYFLSLARAYIQNGKSDLAWEMYVKMMNSDDNLKLLSIISNDCYRVGDYLYSAKSFDAMERIEPKQEYWEGKRGAIIGVFKLVVEQKAPLDHLREAIILLEKSNHPQTFENIVGLNLLIPYYSQYGLTSAAKALYKSPEYDILLYNNIINRLILLGYPEQLRHFPYQQDFAIRGLWFDRTFGNLLKVDGFGNILVGVHGYDYLHRPDIKKHYPNKFISLRHPEKILVMNSLFDIAHTYVLITLIHYFDNHKDYERIGDGTGVRSGDTIISYKSLAEDVSSAVNYVHNDSSLKTDVLQNLDKYIIKDNRIKPLLKLISAHGGRTFLLTNSNYSYTNGVLSYLIGPDWTSYFDVSIVEAKKPLWFVKGTVFRQIDTVTGTPKIGVHQGLLKRVMFMLAVCNSDDFRRLFNVRDREVLYIGDHIFGWRTFLVIPELVKEISIWSQRHDLFEKVVEMTKQIEAMYNQIDVVSLQSTIQEGNTQIRVKQARESTQEMDNYYSKMGSLFRSGSRTTFFASQVERFADLYSSSCYNLLYYPLFYFFRASMTLMPHEVNTDKYIREKNFASNKARRKKNFYSEKSIKAIPHVQEDTVVTTEDEFSTEVSSNKEQMSSETE
ncbi:Intraflagellar transport protein 56 [Dirofilaria immitis]|nr:Intraflagellar transport protein 56 [Dirofilaria immitis]